MSSSLSSTNSPRTTSAPTDALPSPPTRLPEGQGRQGAQPVRIVLATRNAKKCRELQDLLLPHGIAVASLAECPPTPDVVEDGDTFADNAAKKAREIARALGAWTIGEDSGIAVDALGGRPGVYSARYSGPGATDQSNNDLLMEELAGIPAERRGARYVCHVAVADPTGAVRLQVEDYCRGRIAAEPHGTNGFGYDPYFLIREYHRTFGELGPVVKQQLSHRGRALRRLLPALLPLLGAGQAEPDGIGDERGISVHH
ncbi:MAG: RdgB/HAM1 family non-canonical purine NTP pyrophosphatase [Planctomycetaceae bacterium]|nr:RdgB/HAM1 family non-canonical purine NTP pyrophosphatase [Planctomycetaceae bacterium]